MAAVDNKVRTGSRLLAIRLLSYGILFLVSLVVTRSLGPTGRAHYALPLNLAAVVGVFAGMSLDFSSGAMLARGEVSALDATRFLSAATLVLGTGGFLITCGIGLALSDQLLAGASPDLVVVAAAGVPLAIAVQMASGILMRVGALRAYAWGIVVGAVSQLLFVGSARMFAGRLTPAVALAGVGIGWLATALPLGAVLRRRLGARALVPHWPRRIVRPALLGGLALQPATAALYLNLRVDLLIVGALTSARQSGLYSLSSALATIVFLAVNQFTISAMQVQTDAPLNDACVFTFAFIRRASLMTFGGAVVIAGIAWPFIRYVFGSVWTRSYLPFVILAFAAVSFSAEGPARVMLLRMRETRQIAAVATVGLILNIAANFALIPVLNITGAAIASLISYSAYTFLMVKAFARTAGREREAGS